jgi:Bacterial archaeo-eukaryotic release factor family 3
MYMKTTFRSNPEFTRLYDETGKICVSIIIPTHKLSPERQADKVSISRAIEKAGKMLKEKFGVYNLEPVIQSMNDLYNEIDFDHNEEGLGLFVSETNRLMVKFPFPVVEKVIIGNHFEIRDLLIAEKYNTPYLVLHFNEQGAKLYHGQMAHLKEVKDDYFPAKYVDDYEYNLPGKASFHYGSSVVEQFDKDKSVQEAIHFKNFLQKTDKKLAP